MVIGMQTRKGGGGGFKESFKTRLNQLEKYSKMPFTNEWSLQKD